MADRTSRMALPVLDAGQAQKELTHNEALAMIDIAMFASVLSVGANEPSEAPEPGDCHIVGEAPTGAWAGAARAIAGWTDNGWRFVVPHGGAEVWDRAKKVPVRFLDGAWRSGMVAATSIVIGGDQVVGARQPAIIGPSGGTTADTEARTAIDAILAALRAHGLIS